MGALRAASKRSRFTRESRQFGCAASTRTGWDVGEGRLAKPPRGTSHVVLDTPAGLHGKALRQVVDIADKVVVPLQPSIFDIYATRHFLDELAELKKATHKQVGIVGMRVDPRTIAADKLDEFEKGLKLPVIGSLRSTQIYIHLAARGLTLFDVAPGRVERDLEQWQDICRWLDS